MPMKDARIMPGIRTAENDGKGTIFWHPGFTRQTQIIPIDCDDVL